MNVVYTDDALADIVSIMDWLSTHYPTIAPLVVRRIESVVTHITRWPKSARHIIERPGVRAMPLGRYPYVIFYRIVENTIEILHIHHTARQR